MVSKLRSYIKVMRPEEASYLVFGSIGTILFLSIWLSIPVNLLQGTQIVILMTIFSLFGFCINNFFDKDADRMNPLKKNKNPFSHSEVSKSEIIAINSVLFASLFILIYLWFQSYFLLIAVFTANVILYSSHFKKIPLIDLFSHFLLFFPFFLFPALVLGISSDLIFVSAITFFGISNIGELNNQYRDLKYDKKADLKTTLTVLGKDAYNIIYSVSTFLIFASILSISVYLNSILPLIFLPLICLNLTRKIKNDFLGNHYDRIFLVCTITIIASLFSYAIFVS